MSTFKYSGPVYFFERKISNFEEFITQANGIAKAKCNISFQAKMRFKIPVYSKIYLPGKVVELKKDGVLEEQLRMDI